MVAAINRDIAPDVIEMLEAAPGAARRLEALRQQVQDAHALCVPFEDVRECMATRMRTEARLRQLTGHPSQGGHNLSEDDPRTIVAQREFEKATAAAKGIQERADARSAVWREAGYALQAVESYLRDGVPGGCILQDVEPPEPKLAKGQGVLEAITDVRQRGVKLRKRLSEIERAPYPSSVAKARAREWVEALAQRGRIDVSPLIRRKDGELALPVEYVGFGHQQRAGAVCRHGERARSGLAGVAAWRRFGPQARGRNRRGGR